MPGSKDASTRFEALRRQAEELIRRQPETGAGLPSDILELIHELRVHQAELEIQNDELKRAQEEISQLQREFEDLYEFAPCGYLTLNPKGIVTRANLTAVGLLDTPRQLLLHSGFSLFVAAGHEDAYLSARKAAAATGIKHALELPLKRQTGPPLWVWAEITADRDDAGGVIQWRVVLADITEKKAAETILAESEARFRELFTGAPIAYHSLDAEGNVVAVNDRWLSALGYTRKEVLGKSIAEFMSPTYREQYRERFTRGKTVSDILGGEIVLRKKDDTEILAAVEGRIGRDARGGFSQTHSVFHDITAQRKAEKDRRRLEEQLRQAQKMAAMGTLAGGIAHEFNNILSIIVGNTELIADEIPLRQYSPVSDYLGEIRAAGLRARDMVRQLLVFSRQDDAHKVPVGFGAVVKEALKMLRTSLPAQIGIELTVADDVAPVKANATQISQVLINLCRNAADAMPVGEGAIFIDVGNEEMSADVAGHHGLTPGRWVKMAIRDNGRGMDAGTLERIFEPYFTTKAVGEGSGIGLSVVHGIVADHGGAISAHSEPGKGTVFTLRFPAHHGKIPQRRVEPVAPPTGTGRILIVDDEPSLLKLGRKLLERVGYAVTSTTDPADALALVAADPAAVDLVVTDLAMPQMSGERLATEIHKIAPDTPIILCTGFSRQSVGSLSLETGIRAVVMKPYDRAELATAVKKALDDARGEEKH